MTDAIAAPSPPSAPAPVRARDRIEALDVARGVAVLGILLMNIWAFAGPQAIFDYPPAAQDWSGAPLATWAVVRTLFEGSQRALFSLLFGAGMLLLVGRLQATRPGVSPARIYYRRLLWLIVLGLVNAFVLLWPADILITYGLCGLVLYPLRRFGARALLLLALGVFALHAGVRVYSAADAAGLRDTYQTALAAQAAGAAPDEATAASIAAWERLERRARPDLADPELQATIRSVSEGTLGELYRVRARTSLIVQLIVGPRSWYLDALGAMLLGMALFRAGVLTLETRPAVYGWMIAAGYGIGLPLAAWDTVSLIASDFDPVRKAELLVHYDLRRIAVNLGHLGLILLLVRSGRAPALRARLAAVGRMALSNYLGQSLLCGLIFYSVGLGLFGRFTGYWLYGVVAMIWALQLLWSPWWLARYRFGPVEWLWRALSYWIRPAMLRAPASAADRARVS